MRKNYVAIVALFILTGIFLVYFLSIKEDAPVLSEVTVSPEITVSPEVAVPESTVPKTVLSETILPAAIDAPNGVLAESAPLCAQNASSDQNVFSEASIVQAEPSVLQPLMPLVVEPVVSSIEVLQPVEPQAVENFFVEPQPAPILPQPDPVQFAESAPPTSYLYFYTGVPVRPVSMIATPYTTFYTGFVPAAPMPVVQTYTVPLFIPQIVPSRIGHPKWVYPNGVVIKPKVYYPNQPMRNVIRGITP
jgi:hypothetical protein